MARNRFPSWLIVLIALLGSVWFFPEPAPARPDAAGPAASGNLSIKGNLAPTLGLLNLAMVENRGQMAPEVRYCARSDGQTLQFTREGVAFLLTKPAPHDPAAASRGGAWRLFKPPAPGHTAVVRLIPLGMGSEVTLEAVEPQAGVVNVFTGSDPSRWQSGLPAYRAVVYRNAYPGIDLKFYGSGRSLEYDIIVHPGADPRQVKFRLEGIAGLGRTPSGDLAVRLPGGGTILQKKPVVYQDIDGRRLSRRGSFHLEGRETYSFRVAAYDPGRTLVIDPVILSTSYYSGKNGDYGEAVATDGGGNVYVAGYTASGDLFRSPSPVEPYRGSYDGFVFKLSPGGAMLYATYLGGGDEDYCLGLAVDSAGCAYATGYTGSSDFPVRNTPFSIHAGNYDAFVAKLAANGSIAYSACLGGSGEDRSYAIAVDAAGQAYVTGLTLSPDFPTVNAYQAAPQGAVDVFVAKLAADGRSLLYSTYLGSSGNDFGYGIAVDADGCAYVTGSTGFYPVSNPPPPLVEFPQKAALSGAIPPQPPYYYDHAFVAKLDTTQMGEDSLIYSTYLWGNDYDHGMAIAVDQAGSAYVAGMTGSSDFLTPHQSVFFPFKGNPFDAFVVKLGFSGSALSLDFFTLLSGSYNDRCMGLALGQGGDIYVVGDTDSKDFMGINRRVKPGYPDAFVVKIAANLRSYASPVFVANSGIDYGRAIAAWYDVPNSKQYLYATGASVIGKTGFNVFVTKIQD